MLETPFELPKLFRIIKLAKEDAVNLFWYVQLYDPQDKRNTVYPWLFCKKIPVLQVAEQGVESLVFNPLNTIEFFMWLAKRDLRKGIQVNLSLAHREDLEKLPVLYLDSPLLVDVICPDCGVVTTQNSWEEPTVCCCDTCITQDYEQVKFRRLLDEYGKNREVP